MLPLRELQAQFADSLLRDAELPSGLIVEDDLSMEARLDVHRNNIFASLQSVLKCQFPAVCRVLDERFFLYATDTFISLYPPRVAHLSAYGDSFPQFLEKFPPCEKLVYLADLAELEWLVHCAAHAPPASALIPNAIATISPEDLRRMVFHFEPSLHWIGSKWPIDHIWRVNCDSESDPPWIDLEDGGVYLEVRRIRGHVGIRPISPGAHEFRTALSSGVLLDAAAHCAVELDPLFDPSIELASLFDERAITGLVPARQGD